ncbi:MAG: serine hydrolase [Anaerolineaceae bacterium]|nr:serine hydrolase [Anaerolineaceae bacterium]
MLTEDKYQPALTSSIELLSAWIEAQMAYKDQPGLSIGIVYDQELIWAKGFGFADREKENKASASSIYRIASITKLFTSTGILQLRDAGKLNLDEPVSKYLPWFTINPSSTESSEIRIRHLLTHTSGLPREAKAPYWTTAEFPSYQEVQALLPEQSQILPVSTKWKYSNLALSLAGMIISAVSGQSYEEYIETHILKPLGMESTFIKTIDPEHPQLAAAYGRKLPDNTRSARPFGDCKGISPAANMATTVEDLAKFAMLQFRDKDEIDGEKEVLKPATLREMHTVKWLDEDWTAGWGWGFMISRKQGKTYIGHGGSLMGYRTLFQCALQDKVAVIVLTNSDDGNPGYYADKAFEWVAPEIVKAFKPKAKEKKIQPAWEAYIGKYRSAWGDTQIIAYKGELLAIDPSEPDPMEESMKLKPLSENRFVMQEKGGFGAHGEELVFELDEDGKVKRLVMGADYSYPVQEW